MNPKKNILTIYANQDKDVLHYLLLHLQPLAKEFNVSIWSDNPIYPGQQWKPLNQSRLDDADVFLLLLSNSFMYSEFVKQIEFKMVIDRYKEGRATVIPVLLDDCPWDIEFTSDDYNFNFRQLQVFPKNEKPIGDWNTTDETFKEVSHFMTELFTPSIENSDQKEQSIKTEKKILNPKKEEQIAIDFFEEEMNTKAGKKRNHKIEVEAKKRVEENNKPSEQAEAIEVIRKEQRQRQKAEIQKRIEQEKRLKEKAKKDKKIEEAAEAKEVINKENWENEEAKAKKEVVESGREEIVKFENGSEPDKRRGEDVATQRRVIKKSRLAAYNYQFKPTKVAEAQDVALEEEWENEEAKATKKLSEENRDETTKSESGSELLKRLGEVVAKLKKAVTKIGIAIRHNYQFKTAKVVETNDVALEEKWESGGAKAKIEVAEKSRDEISKSENGNELLKKLGVVVARLKKVIKKIGFEIQNYQFKLTGDARQDPKKKKSASEKRRIRSVFFISALIICALLIYMFSGGSEQKSTNLPEIEATGVDSETVTETTTDAGEQGESIPNLAIGDSHGGGIIFEIDQVGKTGKIAHFKDAGPMPWYDAIQIHEQLGEGWRLPTMAELQLMHQTIGQGANNSGHFSDELYWSATAYDEHQARLFRFRNGNSSYHYNKNVAHRKFYVRAVRDFGQ